jgi:serine-type D-Ala-D-Ala carboxypeptidase (penicillin-binding protein 5/6)
MLLLRRAAASLCAGMVAVVGVAAVTAAGAESDLAPTKAWILVDADSGAVLAGHAHHEALPPASTQKLMTALVALEKLPDGSELAVGEIAAAQPAMRIGMQVGQRWDLSDALHSLLMVSANDVAYALAEASSGSLEGFAADMNATARRYGMQDSTFNDPAGFDDSASYNGGSLASAYDLAIAARNALAVPVLAEIAALDKYAFAGPAREHTLTNHNKLLRRYPGAIGMKTGYTRRAGHTFVGAARRDGRTMIAVVLGSDDMYGTTAALLDRGFATPTGDPGIGESVPEVRFAPSMPHLAAMLLGGPRARTAAVDALAKTQQAVAAVADGAVAAIEEVGAETAGPSTGSSGGTSWPDRLAMTAAALFATVVALRIRALRRQRRRALRRRRLAEARHAEATRTVDPDGWDTGCRVQMVRDYERLTNSTR